MMYAIEKILSDTFMESTTYIYLYESKELRDDVFNELLDNTKNLEYTENLTFSDDNIKYYHGGDRVVEISKCELKISKKDDIDKEVFK